MFVRVLRSAIAEFAASGVVVFQTILAHRK